jgi:hypothetical protein
VEGDRVAAVGDSAPGRARTRISTSAVRNMEHGSVPSARAGDEVGIKVAEIAREHDLVFKLVD